MSEQNHQDQPFPAQTSKSAPLTVPPEIWEHIFLFVVTSIRVHSYFLCILGAEVAQVCKEWKGIVLSSPQLWSSIKVVAYDVPSFENLAKGLRIALNRSKQSPLIIEYTALPTYLAGSLQAVAQHQMCMDLLLAEAHRWTEVSLHILPGMDFTQAKSFPNLERVDICVRDSLVDPKLGDTQLLQPFSKAPKLKSLAINQSRFLGCQFPERTKFLFPWSQLTTYTGLDYERPAEWASSRRKPILQSVHIIPRLTEVVELRLVGGKTNFDEFGRPFSLPHLRILHLGAQLSNLLQYLKSPALERLTVTSFSSAASVFPNFLRESRCLLKSCRIEGLTFPSPENTDTSTVPLLQYLSELQTFEMPDSTHALRVLEALRSSAELLPHLESLVIFSSDENSACADPCAVIAEVLEPRIGHIKKAHISINSHPSLSTSQYQATVPRLYRLWKEGMDIAVSLQVGLEKEKLHRVFYHGRKFVQTGWSGHLDDISELELERLGFVQDGETFD